MTHIIEVPFHIGDFLTGTIQMDATEIGAYWMLCIAHYQAGIDGLPDDNKKLALAAKVTPKVWKRIRPTIEGKFTLGDGKWTHEKVISVIEKITDKSTKARDNALKRWELDHAEAHANAMPMDMLEDMQTPCERHANHKPLTSNINNIHLSASSARGAGEQPQPDATEKFFLEFWGKRPGRGALPDSEPAAREAFKEAVANGADPARIVSAMGAYARICRREETAGSRFAKAAANFITDGTWMQYADGGSEDDAGSPAIEVPDWLKPMIPYATSAVELMAWFNSAEPVMQVDGTISAIKASTEFRAKKIKDLYGQGISKCFPNAVITSKGK